MPRACILPEVQSLFYLKGRLANSFLPRASFSSRRGGNWHGSRYTNPQAVADLTSFMVCAPPWSTTETQHNNLGASRILLLTVVSCTGVSVKPIFIPAGDRQWETRVPLAVPWAPLTDVDTSFMASSWWPRERSAPPGFNSSSPETGVWSRTVSLLG